MSDCPVYDQCANADIKCHLCTKQRLFKPGRSRGKGDRAEKNVQRVRNQKAHLRRGSGAVAHAKGDLIDDQILHESKSGYTHINTKGKASFSLKRDWLLKIEREALAEGRLPLLEFHYDSAPDDEIWCSLRASTLFDVLAELRELRNKEDK
jgi:hypothetical protein